MRFFVHVAFAFVVIGAAEFVVSRLGVPHRIDTLLVAGTVVGAGWAAERLGGSPRRTRAARPNAEDRRALRAHLQGTEARRP